MGAQRVGVEGTLAVITVFIYRFEELSEVAAAGSFEVYEGASYREGRFPGFLRLGESVLLGAKRGVAARGYPLGLRRPLHSSLAALGRRA